MGNWLAVSSLALLLFTGGAATTWAIWQRRKHQLHRTANEDARIEALVRTNRVRTEVMAGISHEFRTPLHGLLGAVEVLSTETKLAKEHEEILLRLRESGFELMDLVDELLFHASLETDPQPPNVESIDLYRLIEQITQSFSTGAQGRQIQFDTQVRSTVPKNIRSDRRDLQRIMRSYLSNAFRYTGEGRITLSVSGTPVSGDRVRLRMEVRDSGRGIPPDRIEEMFEPFAFDQLTTPSRLGSHGLGLPIVRRLVKRHNGDCGCQSVVGSGSLFWAEVEVSLDDAAEVYSESRTHCRVLVVDDDRLNRKLAERMLVNLGCGEVQTAEDGLEALARCKGRRYDLVLMDCQMPNMDGHEATLAIRALEASDGEAKRTPIVALTANALPEERSRALDSGMDQFLTKPITRMELDEVLTRWVGP